VEDLINCPYCQARLKRQSAGFCCELCDRLYPVQGDKIFFRDPSKDNKLINGETDYHRGDNLILKLKSIVKRKPEFFIFLYKVAAPFVGLTAEQFIKKFTSDKVVLNLGSGSKIVNSSIINIDYDPFPGVSIVTDIKTLPFADTSIDGLICESVFEHLPSPVSTINECRRVLKPGGQLYIVTPFMLGYHASPRDYYRWTEYGMAELLQGFKIVESGPAWGPTVAVVSIGGAWLSLFLSFGSKTLYQVWLVFFMFLLSPLTRLDHLIARHVRAVDNAHGLYFIAEKI